MSIEIANTHKLVRTLRKIYTRDELSEMIGTTTSSIIRWERRQFNASGRFGKGFQKAIRNFVQEFDDYPEVQLALEQSLVVRIASR